jgi:PAS domain S-box-containing protein
MKNKHGDQKRTEKMRIIQRDIEYNAWLQGGLNGSLDYILNQLTRVDWIDTGGVYLFDSDSNLELVRYLNVSEDFAKRTGRFSPTSVQVKIIHKKKPLYSTLKDIIETNNMDFTDEGLRAAAVLPLLHEDQVIGSLNLASRTFDSISDEDKLFTESVASRIGSMVAYMRAKDLLQISLQDLDKKVKDRTQKLEKLNKKLKKEVKKHKKTKRALEISENLYRSVFNNAQDGIMLYDASTLKVIDFNFRAHEDLGYSREEFMKLESADYTLYDDKVNRKDTLEKLFTDKYVVLNVRHKAKNGELKFRIVNASLFEIGGKKYILGIIHDVTRLKLTEYKLENVERSFQEMTENVSIGIFRFNSQTRKLIFLNNHARLLLGIGSSDDISDLSLARFGLKQLYTLRLMKKLEMNGELKNHEILFLRADGSKFLGNVNLKVSGYQEDSGVLFIDGTIDDITSLRQAQLELKMANQLVTEMNESLKQRIEEALKVHNKQQAVILQKSKLESLGELAAGIAHEINQPVGIISLALENLKVRFESGKMTQKYLNAKFEGINEHINRIRKIIENIRIFSRDQGSLTLEKVFLNRIVKKAVSLIKTQYKVHKINIEMDLRDGDEFTVGSRVKMEQVLYNLLSNAKYAVDEREISTNETGYSKIIRISTGVADDKKLYLEVWDNGIGIPRKILARIFDPFFTTKSEFVGTGLGLSVVFGIIHEMKGKITVESVVNQYTMFRIVLPMFPQKD